MIDSGASLSIIDTTFAHSNAIRLRATGSSRAVEAVDGRPLSAGAITQETHPVQLEIGAHAETIQFNATSLGHFPVILGLPWLKLHSPAISWSQHRVTFSSDHCCKHCLQHPPVPQPSPCHPAPSRSPATDASQPQPQPQSMPQSPSPQPQPQPSPPQPQPQPQPRPPPSRGPLVSLVGALAFQRATKHGQLFSLTLSSVPEPADAPPQATAVPAQDPASAVPRDYADFASVFSKESASVLPPHRPYDHRITLEPGTTPPFGPLYTLSEVELKALDEYIRENLAKGYIQASTSPAGAPILFVKKRDGSLRLCVDYRGLNKMTIKNRHPLPLIGESLDRLREAAVFTKLDLRSGYNLVRIAEGDEWKTAFRTRYGHFEYRVMPFGLTNAPATFQHFMNDVLRDFLDDFAVVYLDDILIYSRDLDEHKHHVRRVLERLRANGLFAKPEKCAFHRREIEYLGYVVSPDGVTMDPAKVAAIADWPEPATVKQLQVFLGFANFYRRFIHGYSQIATPLTRLLRKDQAFEFDGPARDAFRQLKAAFTTAPVLAHFQPDRPSTIETDASDFAIAAVISQPDSSGVMHPVAFYSRKLTDAELNYEIYDKEMLAIVTAFKEWRAYLEGAAHPATIYTDHRNLEYFATTKVLNRRQARWSELLANYSFTIVYRPGKAMGKPDAMSRRHDFAEGSKASDAPAHTLLKPGQLVLAAVRTPADSESPLLRDIRAAQPHDPALQPLLPLLRDPEIPRDDDAQRRLGGFSLRDGLVLFNGLVYVPASDAIKVQVLRQCHDSPAAGHFGQAKTFELVTRDFYWPRVRRYVNRYVATCDTCARVKVPRHKRHGLLVPLPVPARPWASISMDFIVRLPPSTLGYDAILVVVDRFTKMARFIATSSAVDSHDVAQLFVEHVYRAHGLPADIVSDRDKVFTSRFWRHFLALCNIQPNLSTAFHPQTDGQTERVNQVLEQYLRAFCDYQQDNWQSLLPHAEFAYNNAAHASTGKTPFFANYGYHPTGPSTASPPALTPTPDSSSPAADRLVDVLRDLHGQLTLSLAAAAETHARFYNRKVKAAPQLKADDQVWLLRHNIATTRPSSKLDYKRLGPFRVVERIGKAAYRLELPADWRIHPVFHVALLEPYRASDIPGRVQDPLPAVDVDGQEEFEVETVLDSRLRHGQLQYFVHWKDWPISSRTWEPAANLANAPGPVDAFHRAYPHKPRPAQPESADQARLAELALQGGTNCHASRHGCTARPMAAGRDGAHIAQVDALPSLDMPAPPADLSAATVAGHLLDLDARRLAICPLVY